MPSDQLFRAFSRPNRWIVGICCAKLEAAEHTEWLQLSCELVQSKKVAPPP